MKRIASTILVLFAILATPLKVPAENSRPMDPRYGNNDELSGVLFVGYQVDIGITAEASSALPFHK